MPEPATPQPQLSIKRLSSGWWHIRGQGPCNWTQPPTWPATEDEIRKHAFPEASEEFLRQAIRANEQTGGEG